MGSRSGWLGAFVALAMACASPAAAAVPVSLGYSPDQAIASDQLTPDGFAKAIAAGGGTLARVQVVWSDIQPRERPIAAGAWAPLDQRISALRRAGVRPVLLFLATPSWARDVGGNLACGGVADFCLAPPAEGYVAAWADFVARTAARYPDAAALEIWNEPNAQFFWRTGPDPPRFTRLVCTSRAAVRLAGVTTPVVAGGLDGGDKLGVQSSDSFLSAAYDAGIGSCVDGVAVHPYPGSVAPGLPSSGFPFELLRVRAVMHAHGDMVHRIWITEIGAPTGDNGLSQAAQAAYLVAAYKLAQGLDVQSFIVHTLIDPYLPSASLGPYGVLESNGTPKLAYAALRDAVAALKPATKRRVRSPARRRRLLPKGVYRGYKSSRSASFPGLG
jgi:hypothetical protein